MTTKTKTRLDQLVRQLRDIREELQEYAGDACTLDGDSTEESDSIDSAIASVEEAMSALDDFFIPDKD